MKRLHYIYCIGMLLYILGIQDGYLALWQNPSEQPIQVFSQKVEMLPKLDQLLLREGIIVRGEENLQKLLEDYLS